MRGSIVDIVPLFPNGANEFGFAIGEVAEWDVGASTNAINIGGGDVSNVEYIGVVDSSITIGSLVGLIRHRSKYYILGAIKEI
jgi:hypothetical protein